MDNKEKKRLKVSSLPIINKHPQPNGQQEVGFDNDADKTKSLELTIKVKQELLQKFLKANPPLTNSLSLLKQNKELNNCITNEVSISLSVEDIYKIITKQELINYPKVIVSNLYLLLTSLFIQVLFLLILAYLRPALMTNKHTCFDQHTMNYIKCHNRDMCSCEHTQGCVSFCYNESYSNCTEKFKNENLHSRNNFISHYGHMKFIKYSIGLNENKSFFQKVNQSFCNSKYYLTFLVLLFSIGGVIGYCLFGPIADVYGKKRALLMLLIGAMIAIIPMGILNYFHKGDNATLFVIHWAFIYFTLGVFLLPLDSMLFLYVLENHPLSEELKSLNVNYIRREAIAFFLFYLCDYFIENMAYAVYFIEGYLVVFTLVLGLYYMETPRFFSERKNHYKPKAKAIRFFTKAWGVVYSIANKTQKTFEGFKRIALINKVILTDSTTLTAQQEDHLKTKDKTILVDDKDDHISNRSFKRSIKTYKIIRKKYHQNKHIEKYYYLMLFCLIGISICYYSIMLSLIANLMNPNILIEDIQKVYVCLYIFFLIVIIIPVLNKIIMECFNFEGLIPYLFVLFTIVSCLFELPELTDNSERINYYGNDIDKRLRVKNLYLLATAFWLITYIYHLYEFLLLRQAPTLYRTLFYFNQKAVCQLTILFSVVSVYLVDTPVLFVGIMGFVVTLLFFVARINWKFEMFEENKDIEDKQKMNKKQA